MSATTACSSSAESCTLQSEIRNLTKAVAALKTERYRSPQSRSGYRSRSRSASSFTICCYHYTFGDQAKSRRPPCTMGAGNGLPQHRSRRAVQNKRGASFSLSESSHLARNYWSTPGPGPASFLHSPASVFKRRVHSYKQRTAHSSLFFANDP